MSEETIYRHTPDMGEISGFGGNYEERCQVMLEAGVKWLVTKTSPADIKAHGYSGVYGILITDSDDAKELEKVIIQAIKDKCGEGPSGAMHQAVMQRLMFISKSGWDQYCKEVRETTRMKTWPSMK